MKMERAQLSFFVALATLLLAIDQALGCSCGRDNEHPHPQQQVCDAHFVVRGQIMTKESVPTDNDPTDNELLPYEIMYTVKVKKIFKGKEFMSKGGKFVQIFTPKSENHCGKPHLEEGTQYLLSAKYASDSEQLRTSYCQWNAEWTEITQAQRQGLKHFYNNYYQKCEISEGMSSLGSMRMAPGNAALPEHSAMLHMQQAGLGNAVAPAKSTRCWLDVEGGTCERLHASCIVKPNGSCDWTKYTKYSKCKELESSTS